MILSINFAILTFSKFFFFFFFLSNSLKHFRVGMYENVLIVFSGMQ